MELKIILRSPQKILPLFLFLFAAAVASMLLFLQTYVDGLGLSYAEQHYSYIGTVRQTYAELPDVQALPDEVIESLQATGLLSAEDRRVTRVGRVEGAINVPDSFLSRALDDFCIFLGTVSEAPALRQTSLYFNEEVMVRVEYVYAGRADTEARNGEMLVVASRPLDAEPLLEKDGRYLFIGAFGNNGFRPELFRLHVFIEPPATIWPGTVSDEVLDQNGVVPVSTSLTTEQAIAAGQAVLEDRGLADMIEVINSLDDRVTLRGTNDMSMLLPVADGSLFYTQGRGINPGDAGANVCVVSLHFANANGLSVGDSINLFSADYAYTSGETQLVAGIESGFPDRTDILRDLTRSESSLGSFTIIGTYNFVNRNAQDYYQASFNDIFVPLQALPDGEQTPARPYTYSFRVQGNDYDAFLNQVEAPLMSEGYALHMTDSDWPEVQETYTLMQGRYALGFAGSVLAFAVVVLAYSLLLVFLYRREFALRRALGTPMRRAHLSFSAPFLFTALPGYAGAVALCYALCAQTLPARLAEIAPSQALGAGDVLGLLALVAAISLVLNYLVLWLLILPNRGKSLQKLLS
ncbi:MAG: ABC transporter permease [Clostridia bacterium]|nr:ABC transporter permease [Clostridia bacterium]